MINGKRFFYKLMYALSFIGIIGISLGIIALILIWIIKPMGVGVNYVINSGIFSLDITEEMISEGFLLSNTFFISLIITLLLISVLLVNIKNFFKNLNHNQIFTQKNAKSIRNVGWVIIILSLVNNIPVVILVRDISESFNFNRTPLSINYEIEYAIVFTGLAILAVGQVFKEAVKIAEENKLTI